MNRTLNSLDAYVEIGNHIKPLYRFAVGRRLRGLANALDRLRSGLDDEVCGLVPRARDPRGLATKVFYGHPFVPREAADPNDAFDCWQEQAR